MASDDQNWDHFLQQSSALGILKPDAVFDVFGGAGGDGAGHGTDDGSSGDHGLGAAAGQMAPDALPSVSDVPAIRVVRTAHSSNGRSVFAADDYVYGYYPYADGASFATVDRRSAIPVSHGRASSSSTSSSSSSSTSSSASSSSTSSSSLPRCPSAGAAFVLCDIPPFRAAMPMRRSLTLDYVVVLAGEVVLCLGGNGNGRGGHGSGGDEKTVQAGEVVVQQGTQHTWLNRTAEPCRLLYVMLAGKKITLANGSVLDKSA